MFKTIFKNSSNQVVQVYQKNGVRLLLLQPGNETMLDFSDKRNLYAKYSLVEYSDCNGQEFMQVKLKKRLGWKEENPQFPFCTFINLARPTVSVTIDGFERIYFPLGIPVKVSCPLDSQYAKMQSMTFIYKVERIQQGQDPEAYIIAPILIKNIIWKTQKQQDNIDKMIRDREYARAKKEAEQRIANIQRT